MIRLVFILRSAIERDVNIQIKAKSFFGARHAVSTLQQLIWYDDEDNLWRILDTVHITDEPKFRYAMSIVSHIDGPSYLRVKLLRLFTDIED